jgi:hypothetical protein
MRHYLRFHDLRAAGIVTNRMTLGRWIASQGFPRGVMLGLNTRAWPADEVEAWLANRPLHQPPDDADDQGAQ